MAYDPKIFYGRPIGRLQYRRRKLHHPMITPEFKQELLSVVMNPENNSFETLIALGLNE